MDVVRERRVCLILLSNCSQLQPLFLLPRCPRQIQRRQCHLSRNTHQYLPWNIAAGRPSSMVSWLGHRLPSCSWYTCCGRFYQTSTSSGSESIGIPVGVCPIFTQSHLKLMLNVLREWAILLPAWSVVVVLLTYFVYFALAIYGTPSFSSMSTMTGTYS